jgi:hypothetical protein
MIDDFVWQPMIQYLESKEYSGFNPRIPAHVALLLSRYILIFICAKFVGQKRSKQMPSFV